MPADRQSLTPTAAALEGSALREVLAELAAVRAEVRELAARDPRKAPTATPEIGATSAAGERLTISTYAEHWLEQRRADGVVSSVDLESRLRVHFLATFGELELRALTGAMVKAWALELKGKSRFGGGGKLAPRTVVGVYFTASQLLADAEADGLIEQSPFNRRRDRLPKAVDRDPDWRARATFTKREIERLLDPGNLIAEDRRMFYTLSFFGGGLRFGEAAARRWRHWRREQKPLTALDVTTSYSARLAREKDCKAGRVRTVPVHGALAHALADWEANGWPKFFGRSPDPDDLIVPARSGGPRGVKRGLVTFHEDLDRLGLPERRQHDLRHAFWGLLLDAGAMKSRVETLVWGRPPGIRGQYDHSEWLALCQEVLKLDIHPGPGRGRRGKKSRQTGSGNAAELLKVGEGHRLASYSPAPPTSPGDGRGGDLDKAATEGSR